MADATNTAMSWDLLADRLRELSASLTDIVDALTEPRWLPPYAAAVYRSLASALLARYRNLVRAGAVWEDMATREVLPLDSLMANYPPQAHALAFPDHDAALVRLRATDEVMIVSHRVRGTHRAPLEIGSNRHLATGRRIFQWVTDVMPMANGKITRIRHYHDPTSLLIDLGLLPNFPGHGADATQPALLALESRASFGIGDAALARRNQESLLKTFNPPRGRTPARLLPLMAPGAVLIDVPFGIVHRTPTTATPGRQEAPPVDDPHATWLTSFPDTTAEVSASYAGEDWAAAEYQVTGTFTNDLALGDTTLQATGATVQLQVLEQATYDHDGHIVDAAEECPTTAMMVDTGALPA